MQPRMVSLNVSECESSRTCATDFAKHCPELETLIGPGIPGFTRVGSEHWRWGVPA